MQGLKNIFQDEENQSLVQNDENKIDIEDEMKFEVNQIENKPKIYFKIIIIQVLEDVAMERQRRMINIKKNMSGVLTLSFKLPFS